MVLVKTVNGGCLNQKTAVGLDVDPAQTISSLTKIGERQNALVCDYLKKEIRCVFDDM